MRSPLLTCCGCQLRQQSCADLRLNSAPRENELPSADTLLQSTAPPELRPHHYTRTDNARTCSEWQKSADGLIPREGGFCTQTPSRNKLAAVLPCARSTLHHVPPQCFSSPAMSTYNAPAANQKSPGSERGVRECARLGTNSRGLGAPAKNRKMRQALHIQQIAEVHRDNQATPQTDAAPPHLQM